MARQKFSAYSEFFYTTFIPVIGGFVVVLNILELIFIINLNKKNRKRIISLIYIASLSASDVLVGVVMSILKSMDPFMKTTLKDDIVAKEFYGILKHVFVRLSLFSSIFNLMALTFDRFMAIKYPFKHRQLGRSFATKICILVWILSFACVVLIYCIARFQLGDVDRYNNLVFPISSYTSTVIFTVMYTMIFLAIRKSSKKSIKGEGSSQRTQSDEGKENEEKSPSKKEIKFLRLVVMTVIAFCLCWLPFSTCNLLKAFGKSCGGKDVERTLFALAFSNSLLNPFVYFAHIRAQLRKLKDYFISIICRRTTSVVYKDHQASSASSRNSQPKNSDSTSFSNMDTVTSMPVPNGPLKATSTTVSGSWQK